MKNKPTPINPWLAEKIKEYRSKHSDTDIRAIYKRDSKFLEPAEVMFSWEEFLACEALREAINSDDFLLTPRWKMDLPEETIDRLYSCNVDMVADLMQITENELHTLYLMIGLDFEPIEKYLAKHGYKLSSSNELTLKIPAMEALTRRNSEWKPWVLNNDEITDGFNIYRPTLQKDWFEKFYMRYAHFEGEEKLRSEYYPIKPDCPGDELPSDYIEFFQATNNLWDNYESLCATNGLTPRVIRPQNIPSSVIDLDSFGNDQFLLIWQASVKAVIDILERTSLFKNSSAGKFLLSGDEERLMILEDEADSMSFQMLLISYVELRIDFDNILIYMNDFDPKPKMHQINKRITPINPWLGSLILGYRKRHSVDEIREEYRKLAKHLPDKRWEDFIAGRALCEEMQRNPVLTIRREDMGLPESATERLKENYVDVVADLMQFTEKEFVDVFESNPADIPPVVEFLEKHGLHLYPFDIYTYKIGALEIPEL